MDKFQIFEVTEQFNHAGSKATSDVAEIAEELGFKKVLVVMDGSKEGIIPKIKRQIRWFKDWNKVYQSIPNDSVVLLQEPFHNKQINRYSNLKKLKDNKHVKFISIVHDVQPLRGDKDVYYEKEFQQMLELSDVFVVHNEKMKSYFLELGISDDKLITLEIFDYLYKKEDKEFKFSKSITMAGNLDAYKAPYIKDLKTIKDVNFELYGLNFNKSIEGENIHYNGVVPSDELPNKLNSGFGLIWDGTSIETCAGPLGNYLKFNNPHKLSLYLASGLPVVIWRQAAEAAFVEKHHLGITVDSLHDLSDILKNIDEKTYQEYLKNVNVISNELMNGVYTKKALEKSLSNI